MEEGQIVHAQEELKCLELDQIKKHIFDPRIDKAIKGFFDNEIKKVSYTPEDRIIFQLQSGQMIEIDNKSKCASLIMINGNRYELNGPLAKENTFMSTLFSQYDDLGFDYYVFALKFGVYLGLYALRIKQMFV